MLTVLLPTRNRIHHCAAQLTLFAKTGLPYPIIVADSSDPAHSDRVLGICAELATYQRFDLGTLMADKLVRAVASVTTPFVVIAPDDDVTLPHAINESLAFLQRRDDYVAAQ